MRSILAMLMVLALTPATFAESHKGKDPKKTSAAQMKKEKAKKKNKKKEDKKAKQEETKSHDDMGAETHSSEDTTEPMGGMDGDNF